MDDVRGYVDPVDDQSRRQFVIDAFFDDPEPAREAVLALEGQGIDADAIRVVGPDAVPISDELRPGTGELPGGLARRSVKGAVVGGIVGAALLTAALLVLDIGSTGMAIALGAPSGAIGGSVLGGFWSVARKLPVTEQAYDTAFMDPQNETPVRVEVRLVDEAAADEAALALRELNPTRVENRRG